MLADLKPYPKYKDSGVVWLGDVPEHWDLVPNRAVMKLKKQIVGERSVDYTLLSLTKRGIISRDMENPEGKFPASFDTYQIIEPGDLVFCHFDIDETPRTVGLSSLSGMITGAYTRFVCHEASMREFTYLLYLSLDSGKMLKPLYSGLRKVITKSTFLSAKLVLPPPPEREGIVRFLDYVDRRVRRAVRAKKKKIELLEEQKQAIIHQAVTRGLDPTVPLKPSGVEWLGDMPEHWQVRKISSLSQRVTKGTTPTTLGREFADVGIRFLKVESISKNRTVLTDMCASIDEETDALLSRSRLRSGDVIVAIAGAIGRVAIVRGHDLPANCNQAVGIISPVQDLASSQWLSLVLSSPRAEQAMRDSAVQSAQANLSLADLKQIKIPLPSRREQDQIQNYVNEAFTDTDRTIACTRREIELLKEYRTRLLADVVTGKFDVREAAANLPDEDEESIEVAESFEEESERELEEVEA